jgi:hypothetical protein
MDFHGSIGIAPAARGEGVAHIAVPDLNGG